MRKPSDPDVLLRYATLATQAGNLEGAISALERLLLIEADQPRVKLELGVLYFRLGSYPAARSYLESVLASPALSPELRGRAERLGIAGRILWLGWRRDLTDLLPALDAAVLTSRDEGTPVALLEALAAGIPVGMHP